MRDYKIFYIFCTVIPTGVNPFIDIVRPLWQNELPFRTRLRVAPWGMLQRGEVPLTTQKGKIIEKVISITGMKIDTPAESDAACIAILEEWLKHAKNGDFVSLCIVAVDVDNRIIEGLTEYQFNIPAMIGGLFKMQLKLADPDESM